MAVNIPTTSIPRIVIVGGGFGGLPLVKGLKDIEAQIVLIDKNNYHTFQPLLYQVAMAELEPDSIAYPLRDIFKKQPNVLFRMAEVLKVNPELKNIETSIGDIAYDYLILALGSHTNFYGLHDVEKYAQSMKTLAESMELRNLILESFEKALLTNDIAEQARLMSFVIVGAGPTGVETAGALGELKKIILPYDYPELDLKKMHIHVIDMENRLLSSMSQTASESAHNFLKKFDVNIWLNVKVLSYDGQMIHLSNGKTIITNNVLWTAGVAGASIPGFTKGVVASNNRLRVDVYNRVQGYENIFAIGDMAAMITDKTPEGHPMLAPVATAQAHQLARNLTALIGEKPMKPFVYKNRGVMATIGRKNAVVDLPWLEFQGTLAWLTWLFVHLLALVGFRNRLVALVNWAWNYFSYNKGLRLIIRAHRKIP